MTKKPFNWVAFWKDVEERTLELDRDKYNYYIEEEDFQGDIL